MAYIPNIKSEQEEMLVAIGMKSERDLYAAIPDDVYLDRPLAIEGGLSEMELVRYFEALQAKNVVYDTVFRGAGSYKHFIPSVVDTLSSRGEFLTAYTPYQAELSQGILQGIFEYQTMICEITGMEVSNASVYDGATAAGEAALMVKDRRRNVLLISATANPQVIETMKTYAIPAGLCVEMIPERDGVTDYDALASLLTKETAGIYIAQPNYYGNLEEMERAAELTHGVGAKLIAGVTPISLGAIKAPGEYGADIAVGDGQALGIPMNFGGPGLGFMAASKGMMRKLPGRIVGETTDSNGKRMYVLTLQAREQHIRREKASSNICSNQAWCALRSAIYMSVMGKQGFEEVAAHSYANAHYLQEQLEKLGFLPVYEKPFFQEFVTTVPIEAETLQCAAKEASILMGLPLRDGNMLWCATELTGKAEVDALIGVLKEVVA